MSESISALSRISAARTFLFVPGNRPERFAKAVAAGADLVVLDLEDAVPPADKLDARNAVKVWLAAGGEALVRVNSHESEWFEGDLELALEDGILGVMLPKAEAGVELERVSQLKPTIALIESGRGVADVERVAEVDGVVRLAYGTIDLALDLETSCDEVLRLVGTRLVIASRAAGIASPVDGVTADFREVGVVEAAMRNARSRGFGAKLCIHPAQIEPVRIAFRPSFEECERARKVIEADLASNGAAVALDGQMVDKPMVAKARQILVDAMTFEQSRNL